MVEKLNPLINGFILILIATVFLIVVADAIFSNTTIQGHVNETVTIAGQTGSVALDDDLVAVSFFGNHTSDLTSLLGTDINVTLLNGSFLTNSTISGADYNVSYTYRPDTFVRDATARTLLRLITIFFAIAIVLFGISLFTRMKEGAI